MAKKRLKTQGNEVSGDIEYLFKLYRELSVRVDALEDELNGVAEYSLTDAGLDKLVAEAMAARPWYAKVGSWLRQGDNGLLVASIGVATALVVAMIALIAR